MKTDEKGLQKLIEGIKFMIFSLLYSVYFKSKLQFAQPN